MATARVSQRGMSTLGELRRQCYVHLLEETVYNRVWMVVGGRYSSRRLCNT